MNLQSLVVVVLRLMALDFLLRVAVQVAPQMLEFFRYSQRSSIDGSPSFFVLPWMVLAGLVIGAVLLWVLALPIARLVTRQLPQEISFGALSLVDCYSIAFISVGLCYIARHFPLVLNWTHYLFKLAVTHSGNSWQEEVKWYDVMQAYIPFIIGIVLFVNGRKWAEILSRRQANNPPPVAPGIDKHEANT